MEYIIRDESVITWKKNLEHLYTFKDFPVFIWCTTSSKVSDISADLSFTICPESWIIQLDKLIPLDILYSEYHSEALGWIRKEHHQQFANFVSKYAGIDILEIWWWNWDGAKEFLRNSQNSNKKRTILEPAPTINSEGNLTVIKWMFDDSFIINPEVDTIVHSHLLEHIYYPKGFLQQLSLTQKDWDKHIFAIPNLYKYMENNYTNCMNFEHTIFLTEYFIDYLLNKYWFEIIEKSYFKEHSIHYATIKNTNIEKIPMISQYQSYKNLFLSYIQYNQSIIDWFNKEIEEYNWEIYIFWAHVFSQYLLHQWLQRDKIKWIIDNSDIKQWKRLYWFNFEVFSPQSLVWKKNVWVILRAWQYQEEVRKQLLEINSNVEIWE